MKKKAKPEVRKLTKEEHIKRHKELHKCLDELITDMISQTEMLPSRTTIMQLMQWSAKQMENPTERK